MKPRFSGLRPQTGAAADSSCLSTSLGDRRWQVALAEMSFRARGREIRSDGAVLAEHRLRQRRGGARRGRISFDKRETQMWGSEPVECDGRAAQTAYLASGGSNCPLSNKLCSYFELYGQMLGPLASVRTPSKNRVSCSDSSVFRFFWSSRFCRYPSPPPIRPSFRPH